MPTVECINCCGVMIPLPADHEEYIQSRLTYDGTRKWFLCTECGGVFCKDKVTGKWNLSPKTYTRFVEEGTVEDLLK